MNVRETRVEFQFDPSGHLAAVESGERDMVCPHAACPADQMNKPWTPTAGPAPQARPRQRRRGVGSPCAGRFI